MKGISPSLSFKVTLAALMVCVSSCVQSTQINGPHLSPVDTMEYQFARLTFHGVTAKIRGSISSGCFPTDEKDSTFAIQTTIDRSDSLHGVPSQFVRDTLVIKNKYVTEWDSITWAFHFYLDSSRRRFSKVCWSYRSSLSDGFFDKWNTLSYDTVFNVAFNVLSDGSLNAHVPGYSRVSCLFDSTMFLGSPECYQVSNLQNSIDTNSADSYIDIHVSPQ